MRTTYGGTAPGISGTHYGGDGLGTPGALVPSDGADGPSYLHPCLNLPADAERRVRGVITRWPAGTFLPEEDGTFSYVGPTDYALFQLYVDGPASTTNIGYGAGIGRIDLNVGVSGGSLAGGVVLDAAAAAGQIAGSGSADLAGDVQLGNAVAGGAIFGDANDVPLPLGNRLVHADRQTPWKLAALDVDEVDVLTFDFVRALVDGETVVSAVPTAEARIGTDAGAADLLVGQHQLHGTQVRKRIAGIGRVVGTTYLLRCEATLNTGREVVAAAFIRVVRRA